MENKKYKKEELQKVVLEASEKEIARTELIQVCLEKLEISKENMKDRSPESEVNRIKSQLGSIVSEFIKQGILLKKDNLIERDKEISVDTIKRDDYLLNIIMELLKNIRYTRTDLLQKVLEKASCIKQKEDTIKGDAGRLINVCVKNGTIVKNGSTYELAKSKQKSLAELNKEQFEKLSDEEFVNQTVLMFAQWYERNKNTILKKQNIDGPNDGGIDGIIDLEDAMGHKEKIIVQVKHREKKSVPVKEVREFYGVYAADNETTKGFFVTNTKFHSESEKFAKKKLNKYFVLINGEQWLKMANECEYNIVENL